MEVSNTTMKNTKERSQTSHDKPNKLISESLRLQCTSTGQTTSSSIAEKSVQWHEHKLSEKKSDLDQKLYKSIIKMNVDRLEIREELARLQKSSSTGALDKLERISLSHNHRKTDSLAPKSREITPPKDLNRRRRSHGVLPVLSQQQGHKQKTLLKAADTGTKITITVGGDTSGESDLSDDEKHTGQHGKDPSKRTISVTSCQFGRKCRSARTELTRFENSTKRYVKELNGKSMNGK